MSSFKSRATMLWVLLVLTLSIVSFFYLVKVDEPVSQTLLAAQSFKDDAQVAASLVDKIPPASLTNKFFWIGIEPDKSEQIELALALISQLKNHNVIQRIIVDQELNMKPDILKLFGHTDLIFAKENIYSLGEKLQELERNNIGYIFVSASIYTASILKRNLINLLVEKYNLKPVSFSLAYLPVSSFDEKNMVFGCSTDDQTGTSQWGCAVINRSRFARKKLAFENSDIWFGLMDSTSENFYNVIMKKK